MLLSDVRVLARGGVFVLVALYARIGAADAPEYETLAKQDQVVIAARIVSNERQLCVEWRLANHRSTGVTVSFERVYISGELEVRRAATVTIPSGRTDGGTTPLADDCQWPQGFRPASLRVLSVTVSATEGRSPALDVVPTRTTTAPVPPITPTEVSGSSGTTEASASAAPQVPNPKDLAIYITEGKPPTANYMTKTKRLDVGVGEVFNEHDGTSEAFGLAAFLRNSELTKSGLTVGLVDHPNEANLTVSGTVESSVVYKYERPSAGPTFAYIGLGTAAGITSLGFLAFAFVDECPGLRRDVANVVSCDEHTGREALGAVGSAVLAVGAMLLLSRHQTHGENHAYTVAYRARLTLRWKGQRVRELDLSGESTLALSAPGKSVRTKILSPLWRELTDAVQSELTKRGLREVAEVKE